MYEERNKNERVKKEEEFSLQGHPTIRSILNQSPNQDRQSVSQCVISCVTLLPPWSTRDIMMTTETVALSLPPSSLRAT